MWFIPFWHPLVLVAGLQDFLLSGVLVVYSLVVKDF